MNQPTEKKSGRGGFRPGAGRKPKKPQPLAPVVATETEKPTGPKGHETVLAGLGEEGFDPRPALEMVAQGLIDPSANQMKALVALMPYVHTKKGEGGKKEQRQADAEKVAGRFASATPPRLVAAGGRKV